MTSHYIRQSSKLDVDFEFKNRLYNEDKIFIHYPLSADGTLPEGQDNVSLDPAHYPTKDGHIVRRFTNLAKSGGYVFADYGTGLPYKVGVVNPESKVILEKGKWGSKNNLTGRVATVKALQLDRVITLSATQAIIFKLNRPRQGTLCRWHSIGERMEYLMSGQKTKFSLPYFTPDQQEVMCGEFLRSGLGEQYGLPQIAAYLTPIGRTMADVDVYGITALGHKVLAQVTYDGVRSGKIGQLRQYLIDPENRVLYFCNSGETEKEIEGITVFPLEKVYDAYCNSEVGRKWLTLISLDGPKS